MTARPPLARTLPSGDPALHPTPALPMTLLISATNPSQPDVGTENREFETPGTAAVKHEADDTSVSSDDSSVRHLFEDTSSDEGAQCGMLRPPFLGSQKRGVGEGVDVASPLNAKATDPPRYLRRPPAHNSSTLSTADESKTFGDTSPDEAAELAFFCNHAAGASQINSDDAQQEPRDEEEHVQLLPGFRDKIYGDEKEASAPATQVEQPPQIDKMGQDPVVFSKRNCKKYSYKTKQDVLNGKAPCDTVSKGTRRNWRVKRHIIDAAVELGYGSSKGLSGDKYAKVKRRAIELQEVELPPDGQTNGDSKKQNGGSKSHAQEIGEEVLAIDVQSLSLEDLKQRIIDLQKSPSNSSSSAYTTGKSSRLSGHTCTQPKRPLEYEQSSSKNKKRCNRLASTSSRNNMPTGRNCPSKFSPKIQVALGSEHDSGYSSEDDDSAVPRASDVVANNIISSDDSNSEDGSKIHEKASDSQTQCINPLIGATVHIATGIFKGLSGKITATEERGWWTVDNEKMIGRKVQSKDCHIVDNGTTDMHAIRELYQKRRARLHVTKPGRTTLNGDNSLKTRELEKLKDSLRRGIHSHAPNLEASEESPSGGMREYRRPKRCAAGSAEVASRYFDDTEQRDLAKPIHYFNVPKVLAEMSAQLKCEMLQQSNPNNNLGVDSGEMIKSSDEIQPGYFRAHLRNDTSRELDKLNFLPGCLKIKTSAARIGIAFLNTKDGQCDCHFDKDSSALFVVSGFKQVMIAPPMKNHAAEFNFRGNLDNVYPFADDHRLHGGLNFRSVYLGPGSTLFIPKFWIHCIRSIGSPNTLALSFQVEFNDDRERFWPMNALIGVEPREDALFDCVVRSSCGYQGDDSDDTCFVCNEGGELICCEAPGCKKAYHAGCLHVDIDTLPLTWYCPDCALPKKDNHNDKRTMDGKDAKGKDLTCPDRKKPFGSYRGCNYHIDRKVCTRIPTAKEPTSNNSGKEENIKQEKNVKVVESSCTNLSGNIPARRSNRKIVGCGICTRGFEGDQMWLLLCKHTGKTEPEYLKIKKHLICTGCLPVTSKLGTEFVPLDHDIGGCPLLSKGEFSEKGLSTQFYDKCAYGLASSVDYAVAVSGLSLNCGYPTVPKH